MANANDDQGSPHGVLERRRYPRYRPASGLVLTVPAVTHAEVIDISARGAMISTPASVVRGQRCQLHVLLDRDPFSATVEVLRVDEGTRGGGERRNRVGLSFVSLDDNSRRTLQRFVKNDGKAR